MKYAEHRQSGECRADYVMMDDAFLSVQLAAALVVAPQNAPGKTERGAV